MAKIAARRATNLILISMMGLVAVVGVILQSRSIESKANEARQETTTPSTGDEPEQGLRQLIEKPERQTDYPTEQNLVSTLWKVVIYVLLILAAIIIGARVLRRYGGDKLKQTSSPDIRILGRRYISPKQSIVMVQVRNKELLLGITDHSVRLLYDFTPENKEDGTEFAQ
ncbi:flagellar biosynthetic protein FliO [Candidatus Neomarinimicrobiota bacterium]